MDTRTEATMIGQKVTKPNTAGARLLATIVVFALMQTTTHATTLVEVDLLGRIQASGGTLNSHGFGAFGFYAGKDFSGDWIDHQHTNWDWDTLAMHICDDGSANISGTARRHDDSLWTMNIDLTGIVFKGDVFNGVTMPYATMLEDLEASMEDGAGLEWTSLSLDMTAPYATELPLTGWTGFAMPSMGHINVAELHYDAGVGLTFESWYKHEGTSYYQVGDSKANVILDGGFDPQTAPTPEPNTAILAMLALAGLTMMRRPTRRRIR